MLTMTIPPVAAAATLTGLYGPVAGLAGVAVVVALGVLVAGLVAERIAASARRRTRAAGRDAPDPAVCGRPPDEHGDESGMTTAFDPLSPDFLNDPYPAYHFLRATDPVHWLELPIPEMPRGVAAHALRRRVRRAARRALLGREDDVRRHPSPTARSTAC